MSKKGTEPCVKGLGHGHLKKQDLIGVAFEFIL